MRWRYAVWVKIPSEIKKLLNEFSVKNLHLSILWPFYLNQNTTEKMVLDKMASVSVDSFAARLSEMLVWKQKSKKILVVIVEPKDKFQKIFEEVMTKLRGEIVFDKSVFTGGKLPDFLPHVTVDYDFRGQKENWNFKNGVFKVSEIGLYREEKKGKWVRV